jgi:high-affinity nickel permease
MIMSAEQSPLVGYFMGSGHSQTKCFEIAVTVPVHFLAKLSVTDVVNAVQSISTSVGHAVSRVFYYLYVGSVRVAGGLDRVFTWPSQRESVHYAIFGIAAPQG